MSSLFTNATRAIQRAATLACIQSKWEARIVVFLLSQDIRLYIFFLFFSVLHTGLGGGKARREYENATQWGKMGGQPAEHSLEIVSYDSAVVVKLN